MSDTKLESDKQHQNTEQLSVGNISSAGIHSLQGESSSVDYPYKSTETNLPPGYRSIQGLFATELDNQALKSVYPRDLVQENPPILEPAAANELNLAAQHAESTKATRTHTNNPEGVPSEYWRLRSEISEDIARKNISNGLRSDPFSANGSNYPGYDVFGSKELCSVKVFGYKEIQKGDQKILQPRYDEYRKELDDLMSPESNQNKRAAERLWELKNSEEWNTLREHLPSEVAGAKSETEMAMAIADNSTMRIPEDQVDDVRNYFMNKHHMSYETACKRIRTIDERFTTAHYQVRAAEIWMNRQREFDSLRERIGDK